MTGKTAAIITPIFCAFLCAAIGIAVYVPGESIRAALEMLIYTVAITAAALSIGGLLLLAWIGYMRGAMFQADLSIKRADAQQRIIQSQITIASQGSVIVSHRVDNGRVYSNLLYGNESRIIDQPPAMAQLPPPELPTMVTLQSLLPGLRGDMENLVLGVEMVNGVVRPVTISLYDLFHTIVAASSGWGKSVFAQSLLTQLAICPDLVEFVLIDQQDHGLAAFRQCDRLRYPILRQPGEILSALREVYSEAIGKRSELFRAVDADDLQHYNQISNDYLPPIVVAVDEAAALLNGDKTIGDELKRHTWELRKFGVYQILMLTSAKGVVIDTDHRQQFSSKVQLHANGREQARLLLDAPHAIELPPGRAVVELPGMQLATIQTPYTDKRWVRSILRPGAMPAAPLVVEMPGNLTDKQRATLAAFDNGETQTAAIARAVYGEAGGKQIDLVERTLRKAGRV